MDKKKLTPGQIAEAEQDAKDPSHEKYPDQVTDNKPQPGKERASHPEADEPKK
jgi:hypothetical protein